MTTHVDPEALDRHPLGHAFLSHRRFVAVVGIYEVRCLIPTACHWIDPRGGTCGLPEAAHRTIERRRPRDPRPIPTLAQASLAVTGLLLALAYVIGTAFGHWILRIAE